MNVENNNNSNNIIKPAISEKEQPAAANDYKKELINEMYKKARQEVPSDENTVLFDPIFVKYTDPKTKDISSLIVGSAYNTKIPTQKALRAAYQPSDSDNAYSMNIKRGSKQDILDYLGDERNHPEIKGYLSILQEKAFQNR